jgi:colanic acid/amylovoran biosynthesis glycosyltransferase
VVSERIPERFLVRFSFSRYGRSIYHTYVVDFVRMTGAFAPPMPTPPPLPERAYVLSQFPEFCETFILNEMLQLRDQGIPFTIFSLKRCRDGKYQPGARELMERSTVYPPSLLSFTVFASHIRILTRNPTAYFYCATLLLRTLLASPILFSKSLYVFLLAPWFAREANRRAIQHVHAHWISIPGTAGLFIARMAGTSYSVTAHAYDIFIDRTLLREKIASSMYVATCTEYNRKYLVERYPDVASGKVYTFYHGVDLATFDRPHDGENEKPEILSVGRLCETKGFPDLIEACRILKDRGMQFACRIVGNGPLRESLVEQILRSGLEDTVEILGLLPRDRVIAHYRTARVFCLPCVVAPNGDRDGLPNVICEAMAMELPVVATSVSGIPEAIRDGDTGLIVPPHDPKSLADTIASIWDDPDTRRRIGQNARQSIREKFNLTSCTKALAEFIRNRHDR